ncbi:MAG: DegT/DnrJ/EryC1/StrS family aminotransferase [Gemmatimonadales bacterium]
MSRAPAAIQVPLIDLQAQYAAIREKVMPAVQAVIERQQFILGPEVLELENAIARLSHTQHAISCASGTDALLLPLRALDLNPGDEVILPAFTMGATATAVANAGGTPVFVDIERKTFNLSPAAVAAAVSPRTRAIIVVHLFGQMAPMEAILDLAEPRGIPVIEDAAQAIGARRNFRGAWRRAGEAGWVGSLSFFPTKNLGAWGDGGMMLTQDDALAERLRRLRVHGGLRKYYHDEVGTNSRLDTIQAAVLLAKLPFLAGWSAARRERATWYDARFAGQGAVVPPAIDPANEPIFHQYTIRVPRRDALRAHLESRGIGCAVYYPLALHLQPCFAHLGYRPGSLPEAEAATAEVLSLPVYPELTPEQQETVVQAVLEFSGGRS